MAKKNDFFDEEVVVDSAEDAGVQSAEEKPAEAEEAPVVTEAVEEDSFDDFKSDEFADDTDDNDYEEIEEIIAIEEAEKQRVIKLVISFVCIGVAVVGAIAVLYRFFFGKDE